MSEPSFPVTEEQGVAFGLTAPFVNRAVINSTGVNMRIAFIEQVPGADGKLISHGRAAVMMQMNDAVGLRDALTQILDETAAIMAQRG